MNLKQKILAAGLAAIIGGAGIFGANTAQATAISMPSNDAVIAQMMQMIESLKQQIAQIIALIAQLKPQETCGNGYCRFGETAATCAADCEITTCSHSLAKDACAKSGGRWGCNPGFGGCGCSCPPSPQQIASCAQLCQSVNATYVNNQSCGASENRFVKVSGVTACCCQKSTPVCFAENQLAVSAQQCCAGLSAVIDNTITNSTGAALYKCVKSVCGNGACEIGETPSSCATDCH